MLSTSWLECPECFIIYYMLAGYTYGRFAAIRTAIRIREQFGSWEADKGEIFLSATRQIVPPVDAAQAPKDSQHFLRHYKLIIEGIMREEAVGSALMDAK